jgi:hypothetical protein
MEFRGRRFAAPLFSFKHGCFRKACPSPCVLPRSIADQRYAICRQLAFTKSSSCGWQLTTNIYLLMGVLVPVLLRTLGSGATATSTPAQPPAAQLALVPTSSRQHINLARLAARGNLRKCGASPRMLKKALADWSSSGTHNINKTPRTEPIAKQQMMRLVEAERLSIVTLLLTGRRVASQRVLPKQP